MADLSRCLAELLAGGDLAAGLGVHRLLGELLGAELQPAEGAAVADLAAERARRAGR